MTKTFEERKRVILEELYHSKGQAEEVFINEAIFKLNALYSRTQSRKIKGAGKLNRSADSH